MVDASSQASVLIRRIFEQRNIEQKNICRKLNKAINKTVYDDR